MIKLLLVEDDANLCYIIRGGLEDMIGGYEVMTASNGEEGLKIWKEQHLDIIISDIEMPVMDGYEMVRRIRETDGFIPIVFTSGRVSPKDVVKGYELGVNNYIKKPFLAEELDAHIGALLKMKRGMGAISQSMKKNNSKIVGVCVKDMYYEEKYNENCDEIVICDGLSERKQCMKKMASRLICSFTL